MLDFCSFAIGYCFIKGGYSGYSDVASLHMINLQPEFGPLLKLYLSVSRSMAGRGDLIPGVSWCVQESWPPCCLCICVDMGTN